MLQVHTELIASRQPALLAIRQGFSSLDIQDHLAGFSPTELAVLFFGEQYLDVQRVLQAIKVDND